MRQSEFKIAMLDQLNSVYGLAYAMTLCSRVADELTFLSFEDVLNQVKAKNRIATSPRVLLFRSLYQGLCSAICTENADICFEVDPLETPEALGTVRDWAIDWESHADQLKPALESLPIRLRFVLYLWSVEDVPLHEIADVLGVSRAEVCARLKQARDWLSSRITSELPPARLRAKVRSGSAGATPAFFSR